VLDHQDRVALVDEALHHIHQVMESSKSLVLQALSMT
jgi:hypothetical protein